MTSSIRCVVLGIALALGLFSAAVAGPLEDGKAARERGDYAAALRLLRPLAEGGNAEAQSHLGGMYSDGQGVGQDYVQAVNWFRKAAEQGRARSQGRLGSMYEFGLGVPQNYVQALNWYRKSADQGDARSQGNLGRMYEGGYGVPQDYVQALSWYRKAADQGDYDAQAALGAAYYAGQGVPKDYVQAARWYRKAADQGFSMSQRDLGYMYAEGQGLPQDYVLAYMWLNLAASQNTPERAEYARQRDSLSVEMSPAQVAEAQRLSAGWKPVEAGETSADTGPTTLPWLWIGIIAAGALAVSLVLSLVGRNKLRLGERDNPFMK